MISLIGFYCDDYLKPRRLWNFNLYWWGQSPLRHVRLHRKENGKYAYRFYYHYFVQELPLGESSLPNAFYYEGPEFDDEDAAITWFKTYCTAYQPFPWAT